MEHENDSLAPEPTCIETMQRNISVKMMVACILSCAIGIVLMALTAHYLLMWVFVLIIACMFVTAPLLTAGRISIETACLAPMLLLCFVYTPISWFSLDGLLGCTPYLSILFSTLITLTYYRKIQTLLLSFYAALMLGLCVHWLANHPDAWQGHLVVHVLIAYVITGVLTISIADAVKRKSLDINRRIASLALRDDLTGLFNRRASMQILPQIEQAFAETRAEYALVMIDIDRFKGINDLYGHHFGDSALKSLAACIRTHTRSTDYSFRLGGDEFLLVLPNADEHSVCGICERIEAALHEVRGYAFPIRVSMGFALRSESPTAAGAQELADRRMYAAKHAQGESAPISV